MPARRIGPVGTTFRLVVGLGLLVLALFQERGGHLTWGIQVHEAVLGLMVFPSVMVAIVLMARRSSGGPIRFTGSGGLLVNCAVLVALFSIPYTRGAVALFYGASLLVAAWRGLPGCEATILPNLLFGRDDQIGCPSSRPWTRPRATSPVAARASGVILGVAPEDPTPPRVTAGELGCAHLAPRPRFGRRVRRHAPGRLAS
jgi:hypothetical protein